MKRLFLSALLLAAVPAVSLAQDMSIIGNELPAARKRTPFVKQHELRLTAGAYPVIPFINWDHWDICGNQFIDRTYRGAEYTSGAWSLSYDYRFKKWFDLGIVFSHYGIYSKSYSIEDSSLVDRNRAHYLTVMPMVRFTWLNREWVRMYTSIGLGATFGFGQRDYDDGRFSDSILAFQFTPIGIAVGRSFFGFAEVGVGAQGALMMGVGYKFKPKKGGVK